MNDVQEMTHGLNVGYEYAINTQVIEKAFSLSKNKTFYHRQQFLKQKSHFMECQATDVYVFCTTAHDAENDDGELSMWRGYGESGRGAALIFNTEFLREYGDSPLLFAEVRYMNEKDRLKSIWDSLQRWQNAAYSIDKSNFKEEEITSMMQSLFVSLLLMALTTKHVGFREEREWRLIHLPFLSNAAVLKDSLSYHIGPRGVEPKLKFPLTPMQLDPPEHWTFNSILHKVLIGPGMSDRLHRVAMERMLADCGRGDFADRLKFSTIALRI